MEGEASSLILLAKDFVESAQLLFPIQKVLLTLWEVII